MILFVGAGAAGANSGSGNITGHGLPAGLGAGDWMVCICHSADNVTITTPAGWTLKQAQNAGTTLRQTIFWRYWQPGDAAPSLVHAAGDSAQGRIFAFRGVGNGVADPIEAIASQAGTATATATAPTITTLSQVAAIIGAWGEDVAGNTSGGPTWASYSGTDPTFAEIGDNTVPTPGVNELSAGIAWGIKEPAAATGARTAVVSGAAATPTNVIGTLMALTPTVAPLPSSDYTNFPKSPMRR